MAKKNPLRISFQAFQADLAQQTGYNQRVVRKVLNAFLEELQDRLQRGYEVHLKELGTLKAHLFKARVYDVNSKSRRTTQKVHIRLVPTRKARWLIKAGLRVWGRNISDKE